MMRASSRDRRRRETDLVACWKQPAWLLPSWAKSRPLGRTLPRRKTTAGSLDARLLYFCVSDDISGIFLKRREDYQRVHEIHQKNHIQAEMPVAKELARAP